MEIFVFVLGVIMFPISKFNMKMEMLEAVYAVKTEASAYLFHERVGKGIYKLRFNDNDQLKLLLGIGVDNSLHTVYDKVIETLNQDISI